MKSYFNSNLAGKKISKSFVILIIGICFSSLCIQNCKSDSTDKPSIVKKSFTVIENINYKTGENLDEYEKERCKLDLYIPEGQNNFPILVWFHGGSLKHGSKDEDYTKNVAKRFAGEGIGVGVVNYRLSPKVKYPDYINDAAASVAWIMKNISNYNGDPKSVFISGHSAGGYLVYMLVMNPEYLKGYNINSIDIAGVISISGQTFTHYTVREERGIPNPKTTPIVDEASPCFNARENTPHIFAVLADGDSPDRIEENKYLLAFQSNIGKVNHSFREIKDRNHWTLILKIPEQDDPLFLEMLSFIKSNKSSNGSSK